MPKDNTTPGAGSPAAPAAPAASPAVPTFAPPPRLTVPARAALGLDTDTKSDLKEEFSRIDRQQPSNTLPKPRGKRSEPKPETPKPAADPVPDPVEPTTPPAKPAAPAAAPATPAAPAPATPAAPPQKVKIGGKEYSVEELEKALAEKGKETTPPAAPAPAAAPAAAPQEPQDSPEEITRREGEFIQSILPVMRGVEVSDQEYEAVLSGGEEGKAALVSLLKKVEATALLQARKTAHHDFRPTVEKLMQVAQAFNSQQEQLARTATEQIFLQRHPDFNNQQHLDTARAVAEELFKTYPNEVRQMGLEKFADVVAEHTDKIIDGNFKQWNPSYNGSWKQWAKEQKDAAAAAAATPATPAAPVVPAAPVEPAAPAAPAVPPVKPPVPNAPAGRGVSGSPASFHKTVAAQLTES